jgi:preprotein translocase subunit SecG
VLNYGYLALFYLTTGGEIKMFVLKILHFIIAIGVIVGVLLQSGKSAGLSGAIDGGATTFFGKSGKKMEDKISKATTVAEVLFVINSLILAIF